MPTVRIAVADRRRLVRESLCLLLNDEQEIEARELLDGDSGAYDVLLIGAGERATTRSAAARAGVRVIVVDDADSADQIVAAAHGEVTPRVAARSADALSAVESPCSSRLSPREVQILTCIADGLSAGEVSEHLGISRKTVEGHKRRIFTKLDVQNQAHAVAIATRTGLLEGRH
jgi:DNA-binding NarL/FixJ family response regulator